MVSVLLQEFLALGLSTNQEELALALRAGGKQDLVKGNEPESTAHLEFKINYLLGAWQKEKVLTLKMTLSSALF